MVEKAKEKHEPIELDFEAKQNLVGFFKLLLDVDRRVNPHLYQKQPYDRHSDSQNSKVSN